MPGCIADDVVLAISLELLQDGTDAEVAVVGVDGVGAVRVREGKDGGADEALLEVFKGGLAG